MIISLAQMALWVLIWNQRERLEDALKARDKEASVCVCVFSKKVMASTPGEGKNTEWIQVKEWYNKKRMQQKRGEKGMKQTKKCDLKEK